MKTAVVSFGRLNPMTSGHQKLVDKVVDVAKKNAAAPFVVLSKSQDKKKNPLPYKDKLRYAQIAFGANVVKDLRARTIIEVLQELDGKYDNIIVVVGSDRVKEFERLLQKYNGKDYTFESITVQSAGDRDPDAEGVEGMSASKMRQAAVMGDLEKFASGLPPKLKDRSKEVFDSIRKNMGVREDLNEVLNIQQRRKRKLQLRRLKSKIMRGRKIARKRMATPEKLKKRASRAARNIVRKKVAGARGAKYADLPVSARMEIDKKVEKRKALVQRLAKRLAPKVRKAERERLARVRGKKNEEFNILLPVMEALDRYMRKNG